MSTKRYPITEADIIAMHKRMKRGEDCYIPCREDYTGANGTVIRNMMSWGSPVAYKLIVRDGEVYHSFVYEEEACIEVKRKEKV